MPMMRAFFFAMLVMVGLTGCDSVRDISRDPRYATLVGREVKTKVPMWLYDFNTPTAPQHPSLLIEKDSGDHRKVGQLPVGHQVRFNQARRIRNGTSVNEDLRGVTVFKGRTYNIEYHTYAILGEKAWLSLFNYFGVEQPPKKTRR
jgi:hypothetical protein